MTNTSAGGDKSSEDSSADSSNGADQPSGGEANDSAVYSTDQESNDTSRISETDDNQDANGLSDAGVPDEDAGVNIESIYCSAPNEDGIVTIVGLAGSVPADATLNLNTPLPDSVIQIVSGSDGGFVGHISATADSNIQLTLGDKDNPMGLWLVKTGSSESSLQTDILGINGSIETVSSDQIIIHGAGDTLDLAYMLIAGNISLSTGRATQVWCNETNCAFDLLIPGSETNKIEMFLVPLGTLSGSTMVEIITI